ncbi:MAG TPA: hypothetical protein VFG15_30130 [Amycolatopsis sp.]|nr:hypothetical protein [Amycolatopsis sp.]
MINPETPEHIARAETLRNHAAGLLRLAEMVEAHPEIGAAYIEPGAALPLHTWFARTPEQLDKIARAGIARGAKVDQDASGTSYVLRVSWPGIEAQALAARDSVCERVQTGVETVTRTVPDPAAPLVDVTEEIPTYEWKRRSLPTDASGKDSVE